MTEVIKAILALYKSHERAYDNHQSNDSGSTGILFFDYLNTEYFSEHLIEGTGPFSINFIVETDKARSLQSEQLGQQYNQEREYGKWQLSSHRRACPI